MIVSVIMGVASVQLIVQSVESIIRNTIDPHTDIATISIMIATVVVKLTLVIVCKRYVYRIEQSQHELFKHHRELWT